MSTWFDIIMLLILTVSSMCGAYKGLIKFMISLLVFILSIILSYYSQYYVMKIITQYFNSNIVLFIISGIVSYIICVILVHKLFTIILFTRSGIVDKSLGLVAGIMSGTSICLLIFTILTIFLSGSYIQAKTLKDVIIHNTNTNQYPIWLTKSITMPYLESLRQNLTKILSKASLESIKLPTKSELVDMVNKLEKPIPKESNDNSQKLPEEIKQELEKILLDKAKDK